MSIIAIRWAYSRPISNPVAKNVLVFLCSHDFSGNKSVFKVAQICAATAYKERAVREALKELYETGYIDKQTRNGEDGRQLSNSYTYLIPQSYVDEFCKDYELSTPPLAPDAPPPCTERTPPLRHVPDIKNNTKNNTKKSSYATRTEQKASNQNPPAWREAQLANAPHCTAKFWGPGHPDFDRLNSTDERNVS